MQAMTNKNNKRTNKSNRARIVLRSDDQTMIKVCSCFDMLPLFDQIHNITISVAIIICANSSLHIAILNGVIFETLEQRRHAQLLLTANSIVRIQLLFAFIL